MTTLTNYKNPILGGKRERNIKYKKFYIRYYELYFMRKGKR